MDYTHLIEKLQNLPEDKQVEVFDFVEFLTDRFSRPAALQFSDWREKEFTNLSMTQAMRGMEDEPQLYTEADLTERWQ
ncbi:MAG: DUF2281 domain-containing protein [Methylomicrobium sp.]|nr:DUF2281 domain-containing protein [Methylomicrobium sp.]